MKKNNIKGFILAEVIVVSVVVITALTVIYMQFISVNNSYYRSFRYNSVDDLYAVNNIREFIEEDSLDNMIGFLDGKTYVDISSCSYEYFLEYNYCKNLLKTLKVKTLLFTYENVNNLKKDLNNLELSEGMKSFIKTINSDNNNKYRLIVEFEDDRYATLKVGEIKYEMTNLVSNGGFNVNLNGWINTTIATRMATGGINNTGYVRLTPTQKYHYIYTRELFEIPNNHIYYTQAHYRKVGGGDTATFVYNYSNFTNGIRSDYPINDVNEWTFLSSYGVQENAEINYNFLLYGAAKVYVEGMYTDWDNALVIDLTETFGAGNEPSKEWCDKNIDWFEGTIEISYDNL